MGNPLLLIRKIKRLEDLCWEKNYGEGEFYLGKIIPQLTAEQKQEIDDRIIYFRLADHDYSENLLRKICAIDLIYGEDYCDAALIEAGEDGTLLNENHLVWLQNQVLINKS